MENKYQERINLYLKTIAHEVTDRIPVLTQMGTFAVGHAGSKIEEVQSNPEKLIEVYSKPFSEMYSDASVTAGFVFDEISSRIIGNPNWFISEDGQTLQHNQCAPMLAEEYPQLIEDPKKFVRDVLIPRKCSRLAAPYPENYNALKELVAHLKEKAYFDNILKEKLKNEFGIPVFLGKLLASPIDHIFDGYRGFKGVAEDMRRRPQMLLDAINAMLHHSVKSLENTPIAPYPFFATMAHIPTFISPKQMEIFYWPACDKLYNMVNERGGKLLLFMEGNWEKRYDFINSLPKNFAMCIIEDDDIFKAKKEIGDNVAVAGGMVLGRLRYNSKQECVDYAKKLANECGAGGGYVFTTDMELISAKDVNFENLVAVNDFISNYRG